MNFFYITHYFKPNPREDYEDYIYHAVFSSIKEYTEWLNRTNKIYSESHKFIYVSSSCIRKIIPDYDYKRLLEGKRILCPKQWISRVAAL